MPDDPTPPAATAVATAPAEPAPTPAPPAEKTVPYDRFKEVNDALKSEKDARKEMEDRLRELEDKDKSELERERAARERAEAELNETKSGLTRLERSSWVRDAAVEAKFIDSADAIGRVNLAEIESESDAKKAVKRIAENAKHLIQAEPPTPPVAGQVVRQGQVVDPNAPDPAREESERFVQELKTASERGRSVSSVGLLDE